MARPVRVRKVGLTVIWSFPAAGLTLFLMECYLLCFLLLASILWRKALTRRYRARTNLSDAPIDAGGANTRTTNHCKSLGINFDSWTNAMWDLVILTFQEKFLGVMYSTVDAAKVNMAIEKDYNQAVALFSMSFVLLSGIIVLNVLISVVIDKFKEIKQNEAASLFLTVEQQL
eukprot:Platyproteum_vivax@DN7655_c0_g1_i1.p2